VSNSKRVRQVNSISNITINVNGAQFKDQISAARDLGATALNSALFERIERLFLDVDGNLLNPKGRQQQGKKNSADTIYNRCKSLFDQDLTANKGNFFYMVY
jgi:hypothetical protein